MYLMTIGKLTVFFYELINNFNHLHFLYIWISHDKWEKILK